MNRNMPFLSGHHNLNPSIENKIQRKQLKVIIDDKYGPMIDYGNGKKSIHAATSPFESSPELSENNMILQDSIFENTLYNN